MSINIQDHQPLIEISSNEESFFEKAPCGYIFTSPDGLIIKANGTFLDWIKQTNAEIVSKRRFQELLTIGGKIYYETNYAPLLRMQGFVKQVTFDLTRSDGQIVSVIIDSEEFRDPLGNPLYIRSTLFDISERRKYERELLRERKRAEYSEQRFKFLAKSGEALRRSFDYAASFKKVAAAAVHDFCDGCTIDLIEDGQLVRLAEDHRVSGKSIPKLALSEVNALSESFCISDSFSDSAKISQYMTPSLKSFHEDLAPDSMILAPIKQGQDTIGVIGFYITEMSRSFYRDDLELAEDIASRCAMAIESAILHKESERAHIALKESHEWFSTTLNCVDDGVVTINSDKTVSYLNSVAERLTGWTSSEAKGKTMSEVLHIVHGVTEEPVFNPSEQMLQKGVVAAELANDTVLVRRDGTRIHIEASAALIKSSDAHLHGVVLVFRDTTQRHEEDRILRETLGQLQSERQIREKFVATLTHDLRSPITAVKMSAQLILLRTNQTAAVQAQAVRIVNSVNRADQMIQDLLDANRIRAGEVIPLKMSHCDLGVEIRDTVNDLTTIHGDRFILDAPDHLEGNWNGAALRRIIENLCNNAVKYGAERAPIRITLKAESDEVVISVHNEGNPISVADQATLFDAYRRTESALSSGQKGWGLGLTLVRGVTEAHQGRVTVESSPEHGTTFLLHFPRSLPAS